MAESGTLLRCYTRKGIEGSNPSLSAQFYEFEIVIIELLIEAVYLVKGLVAGPDITFPLKSNIEL